MPFHSWIRNDRFKYFNLTVDDPNVTVGIRVTIYSGDVDIYVKADQRPTQDDFHFASYFYGNETFTISPGNREDIGFPTGNYVIGIWGLERSTFILTATVNEHSIVPLISDIPL
jgi:hypothetical protein